MDIIDSIVTGVVAGVITSAMLFLVGQFTKKVIIPWYQDIIYKGVVIQGEWCHRFDTSEHSTQTVSADLRQKASEVTGVVTINKSADDPPRTEMFALDLTGEIRNRLFHASLVSKDRRRVNTITLLMEVVGDGMRMSGCASWYDAAEGRILSTEMDWLRTDWPQQPLPGDSSEATGEPPGAPSPSIDTG